VAERLAQWRIDSISVNPASLVKTFRIVAEAERKLPSEPLQMRSVA
jgi:phosphoenolpyruvate synthase/pyruvate phosphate dikinase